MKLISRKEVFKDSVFASFISSWQDLEHPSKNNNLEAGEYFDEETNSVKFFSKEALQLTLDKEISDFNKITDNLKSDALETTGRIVIDAPENIEEVEYLAKTMTLFAKSYALEYTFIPVFNLPWFHDSIENHHPSTKKAYTNFKKIIGDKNYSEGLLVSDYNLLQNILINYFNLIQGNYYGYNFFYAKALKTVFSFHYTGQIWFYIYSQESLNTIKSFITKHKLIVNKQFTSK